MCINHLHLDKNCKLSRSGRAEQSFELRLQKHIRSVRSKKPDLQKWELRNEIRMYGQLLHEWDDLQQGKLHRIRQLRNSSGNTVLRKRDVCLPG